MSPPLVIDTEAVRALAQRIEASAAAADGLRTRVLGLLVTAALDDASAADALASVDDELGLVSAVLRARATQADYPLHDTVALALAAGTATAEADLQRVLGPDAAGVAQGRDAALQLVDGGGDASDDLLRRVLAASSDPSFAYGFAQVLTPQQAADLVLQASSTGAESPSAPPSTPEQRQAWADHQQLLLDAVGRTLAEATRWSDPNTLTADSAEQWVAAITADPRDPDAGGGYGQGAALALLVEHGRFDAPWLARVADGVYRYERSTSQGSDPLWEPRSSVQSAWLGPLEPDGTHAYDPLAPILKALGDSPAAAQAFLTGGDTATRTIGGVELTVPERLTYLLESRRWPVDDGAGLGAALVAATTAVRDRSDAGRVSATLASDTVAIVGERTGKGAGGIWPFDHPGWMAPEGIRPALTEIVTDYMPDVFQTVQVGVEAPFAAGYTTENASFPPGGPYGATFAVKDLAAVMEAIGTDTDRTRQVVAAVLGTERLRLGYAVDRLAAEDPNLAADFLTSAGGGPRVSLTLLDNAVSASGATLGFVIDHGYRGLSDRQARLAESQRHLSELLQVAIGLPFVPTPTGPWGKIALEQTTKGVFDAWASNTPSDASKVYGSLDAAVGAELRDQVLDDLLARGLLRPGTTIAGFQPPPAAALVHGADGAPTDPPRFDRASQAYVAWASNYAPSAWLETQVGLFYSEAFGHVR